MKGSVLVRILMAIAIIGLAFLLATSPVLCSKAYSAETEWGIGGYYGFQQNNPTNWWQTGEDVRSYGSTALSYGYRWDRYLLMGEFSVGNWEWKDANYWSSMVSIVGRYEIAQFKTWAIDTELGLGIGWVENTHLHQPPEGRFQFGLGTRFFVRENSYYRIGWRFEHASSIPSSHDTGYNVHGITVEYHW